MINIRIDPALASRIEETPYLTARNTSIWTTRGLRMAINVGVEGVVGIIPFAGDAFDAAWKAKQRNVRLLDAWLDRPGKTERVSRLFGVSLVLALAALLALGGFF